MFKNIVINAMIVGVIAGALLGILQNFTTTPIILAAEAYEVSETTEATTHSHGGASAHTHQHDDEAWAPQDGFERVTYTILSSILTAIGFAMLTLAAMAASGKTSLLNGLLFGLAGFTIFYIAPALGLSPEIPGTIAANLEGRQAWWLMTVILTAAGLGCLAFLNQYYKLFGLALLAIPHILGAPQPEHHGFANTEPEAVAALTALSGDFILMTGLTLLIFWVATGIVSAHFAKKFIGEQA